MHEDNIIEEFISDIKTKAGKNPNIAILTGAGISAESGLQTFRGEGGLWCGHHVEDVATPQAFIRNPILVHQFYNERRNGLFSDDVAPNDAHKALARLQSKHRGKVTLITQNIDDLHERGGTTEVIHMHGEVCMSFCIHCHTKAPQRQDSSIEDICASCKVKGGMRPDIVWFGEMPYHMDKIDAALSQADLFVSIGTSGNVYPAAGFVLMAANAGAGTLEINLEPSKNAHVFDCGMYGAASQEVPRFVAALLEE